MCSRYLDNNNRHHTAANASWSRWWSAFQGCLGVYEWVCGLLSCNLSPFFANRHFDVTNGFIPLHSSSDHSTRPLFGNSASQPQNTFLPWPNISPHLGGGTPLSKDMIPSSKTCPTLFCHPKNSVHFLKRISVSQIMIFFFFMPDNNIWESRLTDMSDYII